jgi:hypothetical protein
MTQLGTIIPENSSDTVMVSCVVLNPSPPPRECFFRVGCESPLRVRSVTKVDASDASEAMTDWMENPPLMSFP